MRAILEKYLRLNNYYGILSENLKMQLVSHPDYPSIKAVTDTLDYFKIKNIAANIPKSSIDGLPNTFLALMDETEGSNLVLVTKNKTHFRLQFDGNIEKKYVEDKFITKWTGSIVAVEPSMEHKSVSNLALDFPIVLVSIFLIVNVFYSLIPVTIALFILSIIGLFLSYLIVKEELGIHSKFTSRVCASVSSTNGCAEVINSRKGKILTLSLSDLCVTFFVSFTFIYALLGFNSMFSIVVLLSSTPIVCYTIFQQSFVLRKWCTLCLAVASLIGLQLFLVLMNNESFDFSIEYTLDACLIFAFVYTIWYYLKPMITSHLENTKTKLEFLRFKRNQRIFQFMLKQKPLLYPDIIKNKYRLSFGSNTPLVRVDALTNPMCGFCVDAFNAYDQLLGLNSDLVQVNLIFSVPFNVDSNTSTQVASRIIDLFLTEGREAAWAGLKSWYTNRNFEEWQSTLGNSISNMVMVMEILENHVKWSELNKIDYTPATVINGHIFPEEYKLRDLPSLVTDFVLETDILDDNLTLAS